MSEEVPTRQEMFNRAWNGLKAQNWRKAVEEKDGLSKGACLYQCEDGRRCAWGHVDKSLTSKDHGTVSELYLRKKGVAFQLSPDDLTFAIDLQRAHDSSDGPEDMEYRFRQLADQYSLKIPGDQS